MAMANFHVCFHAPIYTHALYYFRCLCLFDMHIVKYIIGIFTTYELYIYGGSSRPCHYILLFINNAEIIPHIFKCQLFGCVRTWNFPLNSSMSSGEKRKVFLLFSIKHFCWRFSSVSFIVTVYFHLILCIFINLVLEKALLDFSRLFIREGATSITWNIINEIWITDSQTFHKTMPAEYCGNFLRRIYHEQFMIIHWIHEKSSEFFERILKQRASARKLNCLRAIQMLIPVLRSFSLHAQNWYVTTNSFLIAKNEEKKTGRQNAPIRLGCCWCWSDDGNSNLT